MQIYKVKDVDEAIELAVKLKADGEYDWFRGQTNLKPPHSRLYRIGSPPNGERIEVRGIHFKSQRFPINL